MNLSPIGKFWKRRVMDAREAQLVWTFCVALAVLVAALYQISGPRNYFGKSASMAAIPEAVKTGNPMNDQSSQHLSALTRTPASPKGAPVALPGITGFDEHETSDQ